MLGDARRKRLRLTSWWTVESRSIVLIAAWWRVPGGSESEGVFIASPENMPTGDLRFWRKTWNNNHELSFTILVNAQVFWRVNIYKLLWCCVRDDIFELVEWKYLEDIINKDWQAGFVTGRLDEEWYRHSLYSADWNISRSVGWTGSWCNSRLLRERHSYWCCWSCGCLKLNVQKHTTDTLTQWTFSLAYFTLINIQGFSHSIIWIKYRSWWLL
jgi:hypothetical protein